MANALGEKRACPKCDAKFYDLNKNPAVCPKCSHSYNPLEEAKPKRIAGKKRVEELRDKNEIAALDEKQKRPKILRDDELGDIDLSGFDDVDVAVIGDDDALEHLEDDAMGGDIESLSELEDREQNEERAGLDESEDDITDLDELEEMDTLMDKIVLDEEVDEDEEDESKSEK